jgi:hypothetical protein
LESTGKGARHCSSSDGFPEEKAWVEIHGKSLITGSRSWWLQPLTCDSIKVFSMTDFKVATWPLWTQSWEDRIVSFCNPVEASGPKVQRAQAESKNVPGSVGALIYPEAHVQASGFRSNDGGQTKNMPAPACQETSMTGHCADMGLSLLNPQRYSGNCFEDEKAEAYTEFICLRSHYKWVKGEDIKT